MNDKIESAELFFMKFSRTRGGKQVKLKDIKAAYQFIEANFRYDFKAIYKEDFF